MNGKEMNDLSRWKCYLLDSIFIKFVKYFSKLPEVHEADIYAVLCLLQFRWSWQTEEKWKIDLVLTL